MVVHTFGDEVLRAKAQPVGEVTDDIRQLARDMLATMYASRGVGLAAEQVGRTERICVIDVPVDAEKEECRVANAGIAMPLVLVDPEILESAGQQRDEEGCLSFPGICVSITRADQVTLRYTDLEGQRRTITVRGLLARAVQHEVDHLDGVLLVDRMSAIQRLSVAGKLKRMRHGKL